MYIIFDIIWWHSKSHATSPQPKRKYSFSNSKTSIHLILMCFYVLWLNFITTDKTAGVIKRPEGNNKDVSNIPTLPHIIISTVCIYDIFYYLKKMGPPVTNRPNCRKYCPSPRKAAASTEKKSLFVRFAKGLDVWYGSFRLIFAFFKITAVTAQREKSQHGIK